MSLENMITQELIGKHLAFLKKGAVKANDASDFTSFRNYIKAFSQISYHYNSSYTDAGAERLLVEASAQFFPQVQIQSLPRKIVFHDSFSADTRGLTQQYLRALFSQGVEILYICSAPEIGRDIGAELSAYGKVQLAFLTEDKESIASVIRTVEQFRPDKVLLHLAPWDIASFCLWNSVHNVERYLINLTDHAFWLGTSCADYFLEFRRYGAFVSTQYRGIPVDKLLLQPYYPIIDKNAFCGIPHKEGCVTAFAGGNLYKISGRNNRFLKLIARVLKGNENVLFLLAGPGDQKPVLKFIAENKLEDRFFLLGNRRDISAVVQHIDIFVNTYPMIGGLMSQYAALFEKPILGFTDEDLFDFNNVEDLLQVAQDRTLVVTSEEDFVDRFNRLIDSREARQANVDHTKECT